MMDTPNAYLGPWYRKPGEKVAMIHDEQAKIKHDLRIGDIIKVKWVKETFGDWLWFRFLGPINKPSGWQIILQGVTDQDSKAFHEGDTFTARENEFTVIEVRQSSDCFELDRGMEMAEEANQSSATPVELADSGSPVIFAVLRDLTTRAEFGERKYGTLLRTDNGRSALQDCYEEALDLAMYLKQAIMEGR